MASSSPLILIPMGDPAGIGPEIAVKALQSSALATICRPLVIGSAAILRRAMEITNSPLTMRAVSTPTQAEYAEGTLNVLDLANALPQDIPFGKVQARAGMAAFEAIRTATGLLLSGHGDAMATTPINKEALRQASLPYIGHTEMLQALCEAPAPLTMFQVGTLRVFFLSRHLSLKDAISYITPAHVYDCLLACEKALQRLGVAKPRIAVAGLNPHGGEHGLFGDEEQAALLPAIERVRREGLDVSDPIGADSVFHLAKEGAFDAVLSLYHDQGHIATKMVDFERTISLTIGLPFLRTSVDHGTAFDIAGTGKASDVSMQEAIKLAAEYAPRYNAAN